MGRAKTSAAPTKESKDRNQAQSQKSRNQSHIVEYRGRSCRRNTLLRIEPIGEVRLKLFREVPIIPDKLRYRCIAAVHWKRMYEVSDGKDAVCGKETKGFVL